MCQAGAGSGGGRAQADCEVADTQEPESRLSNDFVLTRVVHLLFLLHPLFLDCGLADGLELCVQEMAFFYLG